MGSHVYWLGSVCGGLLMTMFHYTPISGESTLRTVPQPWQAGRTWILTILFSHCNAPFLQMRKPRRLREVESLALSCTANVRQVWDFCLIPLGLSTAADGDLLWAAYSYSVSPWAWQCPPQGQGYANTVQFWVPQL